MLPSRLFCCFSHAGLLGGRSVAMRDARCVMRDLLDDKAHLLDVIKPNYLHQTLSSDQ